MDPDLRVCPVIQWPPGAALATLHFLEDVFDDELAAIGLDDSGIIPGRPVCNDQVLAKMGVR